MQKSDGIEVVGEQVDGAERILTPEALAFVASLQRRFGTRRDELLAARRARREEVSRTGRLDFLPETADVRNGDWTVAPAPADLLDRRVEITGPTDRKMTINALNSGARVWLADMEDASTPHWSNVVGGQVSLFDAIRRQISFTSPQGKTYALRDDQRLATIVMRPRGWHFDEQHLLVDGRPVVGALVDFGLYFFHNAAELVARGSGPYFYLPKTESHLEARLWNDVFTFAQAELGIAHGTVRATVLIETIPAAFEMDEILYELREHASGLNAGRWDYLFSIIKYFRDSGAGLRAARPRLGDHDRAVHAGLHRAAGADLPPSRRTRDRRDGGLHPQPQGRGRERQAPLPRSARTRSARPATASTARGSRTPTSSRCAVRSSTVCSVTGPTRSTGCATTCASPPTTCSTSGPPPAA